MVLVVEFVVVVVLGLGLVCGTYLRMRTLRDVPSCLFYTKRVPLISRICLDMYVHLFLVL